MGADKLLVLKGQADRQSNRCRQAAETQGTGRQSHKMTIGGWTLFADSAWLPDDSVGAQVQQQQLPDR